MAQRKSTKSPLDTEVSLIRSSAAEYLTFIAAIRQANAALLPATLERVFAAA